MAEKFATIEDYRCQCDIKHKLCDVLILVTCGVLSGLVEQALGPKKEFMKSFGCEDVFIDGTERPV
ncbi:MAG: transposase family protein [Oscillospiraceae bacterium]|jgi:hypothetical protein|nr:transposase family protein [Oscillospiraceae bacterium]